MKLNSIDKFNGQVEKWCIRLLIFMEEERNHMSEIIRECSKIANVSFPFEGHKDLTSFVSSITKKFGMPFSASQTNKRNNKYVYKCTFNGRRSGSIKCPSHLNFIRFNFKGAEFFSFDQFNSSFSHYHSTSKDFYNVHKNILDEPTIMELRRQQRLGVPPGAFRANLCITMNSKNFYNLRREIIKTEKIENLDCLIAKLKCNQNFHFILHKNETGDFYMLTAIHLKVISASYWNDIVNVDDTVGTNIYDLSLVALVTIDPDDHTQIVAYGFLADKTQESFQMFFDDVFSFSNKSIRVIIMDRCAA